MDISMDTQQHNMLFYFMRNFSKNYTFPTSKSIFSDNFWATPIVMSIRVENRPFSAREVTMLKTHDVAQNKSNRSKVDRMPIEIFPLAALLVKPCAAYLPKPYLSLGA